MFAHEVNEYEHRWCAKQDQQDVCTKLQWLFKFATDESAPIRAEHNVRQVELVVQLPRVIMEDVRRNANPSTADCQRVHLDVTYAVVFLPVMPTHLFYEVVADMTLYAGAPSRVVRSPIAESQHHRGVRIARLHQSFRSMFIKRAVAVDYNPRALVELRAEAPIE